MKNLNNTTAKDEIIDVYDNQWSFFGEQSRKDFYKEQVDLNDKWIIPDHYVNVVNAILLNTKWELLIQKRWLTKNHNPWLYDKTIWWHIIHWSTAENTMQEEALQELDIPSIIYSTSDEFIKSLSENWKYLGKICIMEKISETRVITNKIISGKNYKIWNNIHYYWWIYWWNISFNDWEVEWLIFKNIEEIFLDFESENLLDYTDDLKIFLKKYESYFKKLSEIAIWIKK